MNVNLYVIEDYENETAFRPQKNKPKTNPISPTPKGVKQKSDAACQRSDICLLSSVYGHLGRHWQTKPKLSDELLRKVVEKC